MQLRPVAMIILHVQVLRHLSGTKNFALCLGLRGFAYPVPCKDIFGMLAFSGSKVDTSCL